MKRLISVVALTAMMSVSAQEQNQVSNNIEVNSEDSSTEKSFDISVGYANSTLKDSEGEEIDGSGISFSAGKMFKLGQDFTATTSLGVSFISIDDEDVGLEGNGRAKTYEIGVSQRLAYNIETGGAVIRPFVEGGVSRGNYSVEASFQDEFLSGNLELDIDYTKLGGALGVQVVLANGLVPFVKYDISRVRFDSKGNVSSNINGQSLSEELTFDSDEERNLSSNSLTFGVGYMF